AIHVTRDPYIVINDPQIDAVLIAVPDHFHAPLTLACIAAGKPVLCEKPLSQDVKECLEILAAEEKTGQHLVQVGFMRRFDPSYAEVKALLARGDLGKALMFHCFHRNVAPAYDFRAEMAICNSAPHEFDVARWMMESEFTSISVHRPVAGGATAPVFMVLETNAGQLVNIEVNISATYGYDVRGELVGEKGTAMLRAPVHADVNLGLKQINTYPSDWRLRFVEAYRRQNRAWIKTIVTGKPNLGANAWDGYCSTAVAEAGVAALHSGQPAQVNLIAKPKFYA
ncbi:MAG: Gfo/Idh/MocA family oxidoreductase, partial [Alphaproteobacteria bacterium]|nr:Gfo/Idh/MocA family oxidoreductase [Alphaproteobacteria bacterium]